jgi:DNA-directed RNA polymerase specialized sigma24 family protein
LRSYDDASVQMLLMRHRFGWTLQQIGTALGLKAGAIDGRLRRLVGALRRKAREELDD